MYRAKSAEFYGIPGMKWGKRKKETLEDAKKKYGIKDEPSTAENLRRAAIAREGLQKIKGRRKKINKARRQEIARQYGEARNKKFGFSGSLLKVANFSTAKKTKPGLWEQAKAQAKASMGGKHSARAMQKAVQIYKSKGGGYKGKKSGSNKLSKWTKEKWQYSSEKSKGKGRYRPKKVWERLSQKEKDSLNQSKYKGTKEGKQFVSVPKKLRKKVQP